MSAVVSRLRSLSAVQLALVLALGATAAITAALLFQYVGGYRPCPLCLKERIAYIAAIPAGVIAALLLSAGRISLGRILLVLAAAGLLWNAGLGVYHSGVEWKWWLGPTECGSTGDLVSGGSLLENIASEKRVRCDEAAWRFLGLSFAGWSVVLSLGLAGIGFAGAMAPSRRTAV